MSPKKILPAVPLRPPIVTIMGHVDHGKTSLLDAIRHTRVANHEFGGITQHIGAYQIDRQGKKITFIDTPGHAAFSKMRARGASVTDIIILVIAADDGVMPQTVESIQHIHQAKLPVIVAINKIDMPGANPDNVKSQLTKYEIFCEGFGGQTPAVNVSAKTGEGLDNLLETISLMADLEELTSDPKGPLEAVIIESKLDSHKGPIGTVIVKNGTLYPRTTYFLDGQPVKFRSLNNDLGQSLTQAEPGTPVMLMGFSFVPPVGSLITSVPSLKPVTEVISSIPPETPTNINPAEKPEIPPHLNVILKADTVGTLEAIRQNIAGELAILDSGVGPINESDILLAESTHAFIIGFNVEMTSSAQKLASLEKVKVFTFKIIYELLEFLEKKVLELLEPEIYEEEMGTATIEATYLIRGERIAGCLVKSGRFIKTNPVHAYRGNKLLKNLIIKSLKSGKEDIESAKEGTECGLVFTNPIDFRVGDMLKSYRLIEK